jgi:hypothetical protein
MQSQCLRIPFVTLSRILILRCESHDVVRADEKADTRMDGHEVTK